MGVIRVPGTIPLKERLGALEALVWQNNERIHASRPKPRQLLKKLQHFYPFEGSHDTSYKATEGGLGRKTLFCTIP
jgi:hypothetical protein